jgi:hypothetical protein
MKRVNSRKCLYCKHPFEADSRNAFHQKYCPEPACQKASKKASQSKWLARPENVDYHKGPFAAARVAKWKKENPELVAGQRARMAAVVQDICNAQVVDSKEELSILQNPAECAAEPDSPVVQDFTTMQPLVVIGLIAHFFNILVQEDISSVTRRLQELGKDIANGRSTHDFLKTGNFGNVPGTTAAGAGAVQLGGSAPGA